MSDLAGQTMPDTTLDGFSAEQRFFPGFAQVWCENATDASSRVRATTGAHSPGQFRANGVVQNMQDIEHIFSCKAGAPMVSGNRGQRRRPEELVRLGFAFSCGSVLG